MRRLGLLLAVAACNPAGLTLEVVIDDSNIKKVELFAGERCSGDCPSSTVAPNLPAMAIEHAYVVPDRLPWTVTEQDFDDGVAGFRIEAAQDTSIAILVVLGYDAQDQIRWSSTFHHVDIPQGDAAHWRVQLTPTTAISATLDTQPSGTERIARWQQPSKQLPSCLLLEHWDSSPTPWRELVVPDTDRDCDEVVEELECAPWIPNATAARPPIAEATCVLTTEDQTPSPVCLLGGPECSETAGGSREACVPLDAMYCTSSLVCQCAGRTDFAQCVDAAITEGINVGQMPHMKCALHVDEDGDPCDTATIEADAAAFLAGNTSTCTAIRLNDLMIPLGDFSSSVAIDATSKLKVESFTAPCTAELYFEGTTMPQSKLVVAQLELDNGRHLIVPARIDVKAGCDVPSVCGFFRPAATTVYEGMWQCVGAPPQPLACAPDMQNGCAGPMCNGMCCDAGETCTASGCSCAGGAACIDGDECLQRPGQCGELCCGNGSGVTCPF